MQEVARQLRQAAEGIGFFYIRNHCIPSQVIQQAHAATKQFFQHPKDWKNKLKIKLMNFMKDYRQEKN
ncbi:MAG: 2-oxoglutarate and iron-dependent oxygenase domain-containing protein [SAR324 cluster bacterium]|nr:2-oxoglutarate and iron-dependent oxygenase domain-containing protein [SAR324 cluster bacterium]